jgi:hypothetical protein
MNGTKPWYKSMGEWAAIIIPIFGILLPVLGKAELGKFVTEESTGIIEWLTGLGVLIGSGFAFYGRWRATTEIEK